MFEADFRVTEGEQFDRTGFVNLAGINLFTGTTMEPDKNVSPHWHVERDVTDYSSLFTTSQDGEAMLTNQVDAKYTGRVYWSGRLVFYPQRHADTLQPQPNSIYPLIPGQKVIERAKTEQFGKILLPRNVVRLALEAVMNLWGVERLVSS